MEFFAVVVALIEFNSNCDHNVLEWNIHHLQVFKIIILTNRKSTCYTDGAQQDYSLIRFQSKTIPIQDDLIYLAVNSCWMTYYWFCGHIQDGVLKIQHKLSVWNKAGVNGGAVGLLNLCVWKAQLPVWRKSLCAFPTLACHLWIRAFLTCSKQATKQATNLHLKHSPKPFTRCQKQREITSWINHRQVNKSLTSKIIQLSCSNPFLNLVTVAYHSCTPYSIQTYHAIKDGLELPKKNKTRQSLSSCLLHKSYML